MGWFTSRKHKLDRGTTIDADFIPYDNKGYIIHLDGFGCSSDFSNIVTPHGQAQAYKLVRDIRMVINRRAGIFRNGKVWILDEDGNEPTTEEANNARKLLLNPNPLQTWTDFYIQQKVYKYIFGYCPVYKLRPVGMPGISALYNILPLIFEEKHTGQLYMQSDINNIISSYYLNYGGEKISLRVEDVYIAKDTTVNLDPNCFLPESRLTALQYDAALVRALGDARFTMVEKRGALGILSNDTKDAAGHLPVTDEEKKQIQREYSKYGLSTHKNQLIITDANLKWQQMAISTKDLMLLELGEDAKIQIADMFDYPAELLSSIKGTTYANKREAKKSLYEDVALPEAVSDSEQLTRELELESCRIEIDFSEVPVLQEDEKMRAETLRNTISALDTAYAKGIISILEYRTELSNLIEIEPEDIPDENNGQEANQETETGSGEND